MSTNTKSPRKNVSTACTICRKRKARCDGVYPQCSSCKSAGRPCTYPLARDRRRTQRVPVEPLLNRVRLLEQQLRDNGITALEGTLEPSLATNSEVAENEEQLHLNPQAYSKQTMPFGISHREESLSILPSQSPDAHRLTAADSGDGEIFFSEANSNLGGSHAPAARSDNCTSLSSMALQEPLVSLGGRDQVNQHHHSRAIEERNNTSNQVTDEHEANHLLTDLGSLPIPGDSPLHIFGTTSNRHMLQTNAPFSVHHGPIRKTRGNISDILERAGVAQTVPRELEDHLINLYFAWEDPSIHVVEKGIFLEARAGAATHSDRNNPSSYSELLSNAMCAIGATFSDRVVRDLPQPLAEFFALRAKALLDIELDSPTILTVQALVLMSSHEAAFARDARGWLYSGMAMRLAVDLGLHLDVGRDIQSGLLSPKEAYLRKTAFWGTYVLDRFWSYYVGRPPMLNSHDITVSEPSDDAGYAWSPYVDEPSPSQYHDGAVQDIVRSEIQLCDAMQNFCQSPLPNTTTISKQELQRRTRQTNQGLSLWLKHLPPPLWVNLTDQELYLPHVLQLNMQYHEIIILVNRPSLSTAVEGWEDEAYARLMCTASASAIANLLSRYQQLWTLRRVNIQAVHICLTASLIHLYILSVGHIRDPQWPQSLRDLDICCQALGELSRAFPSALRALDLLIRVRAVWQKELDSQRSNLAKRPSAGIPVEEERWKRIGAVIENVARGALGKSTTTTTTATEEDSSWMEGWSQLQTVLGGDPFALASAGYPSVETNTDGD